MRTLLLTVCLVASTSSLAECKLDPERELSGKWSRMTNQNSYIYKGDRARSFKVENTSDKNVLIIAGGSASSTYWLKGNSANVFRTNTLAISAGGPGAAGKWTMIRDLSCT